MKNKQLVILDGNHIAYRAYYKFFNLKDFDSKPTGVIFGMPRIIESLIRKLKPDKAFLVFDGGRNEYRKKLSPDYKKREQKLGFDRDDFYRQKDAARDLLMALGITTVWKRGHEADDLIAMVTRRYAKKNWDITIVSGDKDFNQLIMPPNPGVHGEVIIFNTSKSKSYGYTTLPKEVGYTAEQCVDYLSLTGDKSDNIPGYPGIGHKRALKFLEENGSIKEFLESDRAFGKVDKVELKRIYKLNKKLIDLKHFYVKVLIKEKIPIIGGHTFDHKAFKEYCSRYETNSFLKPQFINTFKTLYYGK